MPTSSKLFFKSFLYMFSCIFQISNLPFNHLKVYIFSYEESVLLHFDRHITKFYISRNLHGGSNPIFRNTCFTNLLIINIFLLVFLFRIDCFGSHYSEGLSILNYKFQFINFDTKPKL